MAKKALGKGLSALIPQSPFAEEGKGEKIVNIPPQLIRANPAQPRKVFDEDKLRELALSLERHGMVQPLIVVALDSENEGDAKYELIAGERRWRAAQRVGLSEVPCVVRRLTPLEATEVSLIENIQREDLNAVEEAEAYRQLIDSYSYTQEDLAKRLGKSRPYIANSLRLLGLDAQYRAMLNDGRLTAGHARAILMLEHPAQRQLLAKKIIDEKLSVRQAEEWARQYNNQKELIKKVKVAKAAAKNKNQKRDPLLKDIEDHLRNRFATRVALLPKQEGGQIVLDYGSEGDLQRLIDLLLPGEDF